MIKDKSGREYAQYFCGTLNTQGTTPPETVTKQIITGLSTLNKVGWEISALELYISDPWEITGIEELISLRFALAANTLYGMNPMMPAMYLHRGLFLQPGINNATPAINQYGNQVIPNPMTYAMEEPVLIMPQTLYALLEVQANTSIEVAVSFRAWYRQIELKEAEFYDLLQLYNPLGALGS